VVIATVFLTIIGMTAGYVLGERHRRDNQAGSGQNGSGQNGSGQNGSGQAGSGQNGSGQAGPSDTYSSPVADPSPAGPPCPAEASEIAAKLGLPTELSQVFKIETDKGTTVWICQDPDRRLYYQSKTGGLDSPLVQGKNGLFLTKVTKVTDDEYEAVAENGNHFEVSAKLLQIRFTDGRVQADKVDHAE
jgi:hypothetical protein